MGRKFEMLGDDIAVLAQVLRSGSGWADESMLFHILEPSFAFAIIIKSSQGGKSLGPTGGSNSFSFKISAQVVLARLTSEERCHGGALIDVGTEDHFGLVACLQGVASTTASLLSN